MLKAGTANFFSRTLIMMSADPVMCSPPLVCGGPHAL
jgi:hypothetical protein